MFDRNGTNGNGTAPVPVNGHRPDAAIEGEHALLWDGLSPAVTQALAQPLDPALVARRRGRAGRSYAYLEGHVVIAQANEVFGFGGWGYELAGEVALRRIESVNAGTGEVKVGFAYSAPVRVTVAGAPPRTDVGFHAVAEDNAEGHDTAIKGAVTDGLKRAFRSFGDRFGNGLYGDQPAPDAPAKPERKVAPAKSGAAQAKDDAKAASLRKRLLELGVEQGFDEAQVLAAVRRQQGKELNDLSAAQLTPLVERAARKARRAQAA